jgi:hypothetical protein
MQGWALCARHLLRPSYYPAPRQTCQRRACTQARTRSRMPRRGGKATPPWGVSLLIGCFVLHGAAHLGPVQTCGSGWPSRRDYYVAYWQRTAACPKWINILCFFRSEFKEKMKDPSCGAFVRAIRTYVGHVRWNHVTLCLFACA